MAQLDLMDWEPTETHDDPRHLDWPKREFEQDGARIAVRMDEDENYRGWHDVIVWGYDTTGRRRVLSRFQVKAGWEEVQVYVDHWLPQLVKGKVPHGVPVYKLRRVRGE